MTANKLVLLDCDSTLSAIEGIDELGRLRGAATFSAVETMTREAMEGGVPMESIFARRLELIQPTATEMSEIGALYIQHIEPTAKACIDSLRGSGWEVAIVSGGFTQAIQPLADFLSVTTLEAVVLRFDAKGCYVGFDTECPTARTKGKNIVAQRLRQRFEATTIVMVGDGASDLEVKGDADYVVGFGRYAVREKVKAHADAFIHSLADLPATLRHL